jgi:hypothetical protein
MKSAKRNERPLSTEPRQPQPWFEPPGGWRQGMQRLAMGCCPFCGHVLQNISTDTRDGVTWCCVEGCNP